MSTAIELCFADLRVDFANECVWQGREPIRFTPKAFALLCYLAEHPGRLITKDELLRAVWPKSCVTEGVLTTHMRKIRQALRDDPKVPRLIETVHRRGYRFIAPVTTAVHPVLSSTSTPLPRYWVGRQAELTQLHRWLAMALRGQRQVVFVTGEAGIGKTALVETFLTGLGVEGYLWIGRGQGIKHHEASEAYRPMLEALGRLCRQPGGERLIELLGQYAPTWQLQMPAFLSATELEALQRKTSRAMKERMLREMVEAVEVLATERPVVLVLEDLQWCDHATLELISSLAQRPESARLLLIGTYRPVDVIVSGHPLKALKQELLLHGHCKELPLGYLSRAAVGQYLAARFVLENTPRPPAPLRHLVRLLYQRTDGNPLFMIALADHLVARGAMVQLEGRWQLKVKLEEMAVGMPQSLRLIIEMQIEGLSPQEQRVLEAGSVAGVEFSVIEVAAGLQEEVVEVEEWCEGLARRGQFLHSLEAKRWLDNMVAARYGFIHALYQEVLYDRLTVGKRAQLHRRITECRGACRLANRPHSCPP